VAEVGRQLKEQPAGRFVWTVAQSNWARGMLLTLLPVIPFVLLLSLVNQRVRRLRGLYSGIPPFQGALRCMPMRELWLTPRVFLAWHAMAPSPPASPALSPCMAALSLRGPPPLPKVAPLERI